jgi:hypothetical protein
MQEPEPEEEMSENAPTTPETPANPPGKRRRWLKILLISVAVVVVGAVAASAAYIYSIDRSVTRNIKREDALPAESPTGAGQSARPTADPDATGAMNFVLLGSDSRDPGDAGAGRSDSIIIPWLGATVRRRASSLAEIAPALACGNNPDSVSTRPALATR